MSNSEMTPNKESVASGASDNVAMQWAQRQLNSLEAELKQIESKLSLLDKANALHEKDIIDLKQTVGNRFDKLEAILEKNSLKSSAEIEKLDSKLSKILEEHKNDIKILNRLTNRYVGGLAVLVFILTFVGVYMKYAAS